MASTVLNETVFTAVYEWNASKISEILVSLINIVVVTPFAYYIIWYERFGANHRRTLINQLVASICLYLVVYNVFVQSMDIAVTALGPFNFSFCHFRRFVRSILIFQCTLLTTAITIVKYIYIFVMKTPANSREEFWCLFINLWTLMCSCLSHFVFHFLPGRELINIYVCSGSFDQSLISTPVKANLFSRSVFIISFLWFLFVAARIYRYKKNISGSDHLTASPDRPPSRPCRSYQRYAEKWSRQPDVDHWYACIAYTKYCPSWLH